MIAADDPFIRVFGTRYGHDDVVDGLDVPVRFDLQVNLCGPGTNLVCDGQCSTPRKGGYRSFEGGKERLSISVGDREDGDLGDGRRVFNVESLRAGCCADPRGERVAGIQRHVHHAAALDAVLGSPWARRKDVAVEESVIAGVGVDDASHGTFFPCELRLDPAPRSAIPGDHDRALHGDAEPIELLVVFRDPVVHIHQGPCDIAIDRIGVVRWQLLAVLA